jgi:hydroxymethylglutaryl-CoA lyase
MQIVEVGPRDGLQNERVVLDVDTRIRYIEAIVAAGARRIEAVSFARPDLVPQMAGAAEVMAGVPRGSGVRYSGLVMNPRGAQRAIECRVDEANVVVVATDTFSQRNQGKTLDQTLASLPPVIDALVDAGIPVTVTIGAAFGCPFEGEVPVDRVAAIARRVSELPIAELALADTIGVAVPADIRERVAAVRARSASDLRLHLHNTRNTGYANALAALDLGVTTLDASTGGIGGCPFAPAATGNIATEDLIYMAHRSGYETGMDLDAVVAATEFVTSALGIRPDALLGRAGHFPPRQ